jgi:hypothetical protein
MVSLQLRRKSHQAGRETKQNHVRGLASLKGRGHKDHPRNIVTRFKEHQVLNLIFVGGCHIQSIGGHCEKLIPNKNPRLGRAALPDIFRFNASWRGICGWRLRPGVDL